MEFSWFCNGSRTIDQTRTYEQTASPWDGHHKVYLKKEEDCPICKKLSPFNEKLKNQFDEFMKKITSTKLT